jgi:transposase InsO family protein
LNKKSQQKVYDHRLRQLVFETGDITIALRLGVPRSTANSWLRKAPPEVITIGVLGMDVTQLQHEVLKLRRQLGVFVALYRLLLAIVRINGRLNGRRLLDERCKVMLLTTVARARTAFPLRSALRVLGLSESRFHSWARETQGCQNGDEVSCPRRSPNRLTADEVLTIKQMVTGAEYRHVPTGTLAVLAQRLGKVFASPSTWYRLVREHKWRRPRNRVFPAKSKVGLQSTRPDEAWHIDVTIIKLLDGSRLYLHGVIDNFSKKILAWKLAARLEAVNSAAVLCDAINVSVSHEAPTAVVDGGSENFNSAVDELVEGGLLKRLRAQIDITFSNSPIEAFWRSTKHQWLYLNSLDSVTTVKKLVAFYVEEHNSKLPHSAFQGQTPDEMYYGTGSGIPEDLDAAKVKARRSRLEINKELICDTCPASRAAPSVKAAA